MHLGLNCPGSIRDADWPLIEDLGVTYLKTSCDLDAPPGYDPDKLLAFAEDAAAHGCRTVVDMRTDPVQLGKLYGRVFDGLFPEGSEARANPGGGIDVSRIAQRAHGAWLEAMSQVSKRAYGYAERCGHLIKDWEIEGEFTCPVVTRGAFSEHDYTLHLAACHDAIKQADSQARVWTGGNGIHLQLGWLRTLLEPQDERLVCDLERDLRPEEMAQAAAGIEAYCAVHGLDPAQLDLAARTWHERQRLTPEELEARLQEGWRLTGSPWKEAYWFPAGVKDRFDVVNWHHYGHTTAAREQAAKLTLAQQIDAFDTLFTQARALLGEHGARQAFASTEWGVPVSPGDRRRKLASNYYWGGVYTVPENIIGDWYEGCLSCFARHGFEVLCIHELREYDQAARQANFWGAFCGLLGPDGKRRDSFEVVQRWAWEARRNVEEPFEIR